MKYTVSEEQLCDQAFMKTFLGNVVQEILTPKIQDFRRTTKQELLNEHGGRAFLDADNLNYPIINPTTNDLDGTLIYAAALKAVQEGKDDIFVTANNLLEDLDQDELVTITIEGTDSEFGLLKTVLEYVWENNVKSG